MPFCLEFDSFPVPQEQLAGTGHTLPLALGFPFETTTAIARLILGGVLDRHPRLRLLVAHAGAALPALAGRLDACAATDHGSDFGLRRGGRGCLCLTRKPGLESRVALALPFSAFTLECRDHRSNPVSLHDPLPNLVCPP